MKHINRKATYEKYPEIVMTSERDGITSGYEKIIAKIQEGSPRIAVLDCYPGVSDSVRHQFIDGLNADIVIDSDDIFYEGPVLTDMMTSHLTDDRVRGVMYYGFLKDFVDLEKLTKYQQLVNDYPDKRILIHGVGASLITSGDVLVYADLTRWEIQLRYRKGMPNFKQDNVDEEILRKYKRGFFIEWRIADKHKRSLFDKVDFWLDTNIDEQPKMIHAQAFHAAMDQASHQPFRLVPYFDPGVWGGQWMKEVCDLDREEANFAWSFDGVPEENSLIFNFDGTRIEFPAMNLTLSRPRVFLGQRVYDRFGAEFPIRFDFLDTVGGQNLSLQVHPTTDFIRSNYGMPYTQEESYYMLDAKPGAKVYLGVRDDVDPNAMVEDLRRASRGEISFPDEKHINIIDAKPHDHFLIPPGTIHCSGTDGMVLEISSSAYIFTFKLWDWDRVGLDGVPRPIHLEEGEQVIDYDINASFAKDALINHFETLHEEDGYLEERTGLHPREFIATHRHTFNKPITLKIDDNVRMLNLVDGEAIRISDPNNKFEPYEIHYAETFILPAALDTVILEPIGASQGQEVKVLEAFVRDYQ